MSSIRALYAEEGPAPSLLTERRGRGCFDKWMFGWGHQYDAWAKEQDEKLKAAKEQNVRPPELAGDLSARRWRPAVDKNIILSELEPLAQARTGILITILVESAYILMFLASAYYLIRHAKAVYLLRHFGELDALFAPRRDDLSLSRSGKQPCTLADLLAKERQQRQLQRDEVAARKLQALERRRARMAGYQQEQLRASAGMISLHGPETTSQRSAVSNIRGRRERTRFERNLELTKQVNEEEPRRRKRRKSSSVTASPRQKRRRR